MKLSKLHIENFRSIRKETFNCDRLTALVGENNSGKSAVLRALNAFFNYKLEMPSFIEGLHQYANQRMIRIDITFTDVPEKEFYNDKKNNTEFTVRMKYSNKTQKISYEYKKNGKFNLLNDEKFIEVLKEDINYVLIPTNRDQSEITLNESALLKEVLEEYLSKHTSKRDTLTPKVKEATSRLENIALSKVENSIDEYYSMKKNFNFKFSYNKLLDYSILLNDITLNIDEKGQQYNVTESGSGIQSLTIIALYRYLAELRHNNIILGIEEPEINLHPQAQREFIKSIKEQNETNSNETQIIFTTHSAVIADQLEHSEMILFRKVVDDSRGFRTEGNQVPADFWRKYDLEEFKYYQFYRYRNSEFFFAKFVVVVESKNDAEVVRHLLKEKRIDPDLFGVSIINLEGVKNLAYPYFLLKHLKIPHFIIVDKDFFVPYSNGDLKHSRGGSGFPKYKKEYHSTRLIKEIISKDADRGKLLELLSSNHSKAMDLLEDYNMLSLNYNLETDLIASKTAAKLYYSILNIPESDQTQYHLLTQRHNQIKKIDKIISVLDKLPHKNLPNSFKRIKRELGDRIKQVNS